MLCWLNASSPGGGKKSSIMRSLPRGSFVYFIFSFIDFFPSAPITGAKYPDHVVAVCEPYRHDTATRFSKTVVALLGSTVLQVFRYNAVRIGKRQLGKLECNAMLQMVLTIFPLISFEASARHDNTADTKDTYKNMGCKVSVLRRV